MKILWLFKLNTCLFFVQVDGRPKRSEFERTLLCLEISSENGNSANYIWWTIDRLIRQPFCCLYTGNISKTTWYSERYSPHKWCALISTDNKPKHNKPFLLLTLENRQYHLSFENYCSQRQNGFSQNPFLRLTGLHVRCLNECSVNAILKTALTNK